MRTEEPGRSKTAFVILCLGHCGSQHLVALLDSHPEIRCYSEVFGEGGSEAAVTSRLESFSDSRFDDPREYLRDLVARTPERVVGIKFAWSNLRFQPRALQVLRDPALRVVRLRRNHLAKLVSMRLTKKTGMDNDHQGSYGRAQVVLEPGPCLKRLQGFEIEDAALDELSRHLESVELAYEQLQTDPQIEHVQRFLGVEPQALLSDRVKRRTVPLSAAVRNWEELEQALRETRFADCLSEPLPVGR